MKKQNDLSKIVFLIPSLDPDINLVNYVEELIVSGARNIVIVDDGSKIETKHIFDVVANQKEVRVLTHEINYGKGRALKTGFKYVLDNMPEIVGIVTADADGQHSTKDTIAVANRLLETNTVIFGTRNFDEEIVPFKSRNGNKITTEVFKLLYGKRIKDTQTGLRGLPIDFVKKCLTIKGDRFEYEIAMLIEIVRDGYEIIEEPIDTIYINSNRETHFNAFKDSYKIYKIMFKEFLKFTGSSLLSAVVDILTYYVLSKFVFKFNDARIIILFSTILARIISSLFNYYVNRNKVFKSTSKKSFYKYVILAIIQMFTSYYLVNLLFSIFGIESTIIKCIVDILLFFISYRIQRAWVFK